MTDWISVKDRLPKAEVAVIVLTVSDNGYKTITTAMYENGKVSTDDSTWFWYEMDFDYDEDYEKTATLIQTEYILEQFFNRKNKGERQLT